MVTLENGVVDVRSAPVVPQIRFFTGGVIRPATEIDPETLLAIQQRGHELTQARNIRKANRQHRAKRNARKAQKLLTELEALTSKIREPVRGRLIQARLVSLSEVLANCTHNPKAINAELQLIANHFNENDRVCLTKAGEEFLASLPSE